MKYPFSLQNLMNEFAKLPTVGPKTAERYVFYLLKKSPAELKKFAEAVSELKEKITTCQNCGAIAEKNPCLTCSDAKRDKSALCITADYRDMIALEKTGNYVGLYFILGGVINAIEGAGPEKLNIQKLKERLAKNYVREVILALDPSMEGEATVMYLTKIIKKDFSEIKITRLAKGLPMGANLEYADEITLTNALKYRNEL